MIAGLDIFKKKGVMLICGGIALGILLILLGGAVGGKSEAVRKIEFDERAYAAELEAAAKEMLSHIGGVGEVNVAVTLDEAYENVYARDVGSGSEYLKVRSSDGDESGLMLSVKMPRVRGVAVVCEERCDSQTRKEMIELLTALFDVSSADVFVGA